MSNPEELTSASIDKLQPPSEGTRAEFESIVKSLEGFAISSTQRMVELKLGNEEEGLNVYVGITTDHKGHESAWFMFIYFDGTDNLIFPTDDETVDNQARIGEVVANWVAHLPLLQGAWLLEVRGEAQLEDEGLIGIATERLLERSPFQVLDCTDFRLRKKWADGTSIRGEWTNLNDTSLNQGYAACWFNLKDASGTQYLYRHKVDGREELEIRDVRHGGPSVGTEGLAEDIQVSDEEILYMDEDELKEIRASIAADMEVRVRGLKEPNEGKMLQLNSALRVLIAKP